MRIVVIGPYDQEQQDRFRAAAGAAEVIFGANAAAVARRAPGGGWRCRLPPGRVAGGGDPVALAA